MDGGSIFVCFLCEKEFREVDLLQEHMKDHGSVPEMSDELPSRKRSANKEKITAKQYKVTKKQKVSSVATDVNNFNKFTKFTTVTSDVEESNDEQMVSSIDMPNNSFVKNSIKIKQELPKKPSFPTSKRGFALSRAQYPSNVTVGLKKELSKDKVNCNKTPMQTEEKKPEEIQMLKAMKLKQIILNREKMFASKNNASTNKKGVKLMEDEEIEIDEEPSKDFDGKHESVIMVDSSFFSSGSSNKTPLGPTIMNAEPDGFICPVPQKSYVGGAPYQKKKKSFARKVNSGMREANVASYMPDVIKMEPEDDDYSAEDICNNELTIDLKHNRRSGNGSARTKKKKVPIYDDEEEEYDENDEDWQKKVVVRRKGKKRHKFDSEETSYQCLACNKHFRSLSTMRTHARSHDQDKEIHCPYCDEVFPQRYILYEHLVNDHEESSNLTCPICNKIFTRPDSLKSHMVRMHEENGGLNCYVCNKNFPSQGQLEMHVRVHTGERPFKCDLCGKGFVQKIHLKTHLRTMHNVTDMPTTPCRLCDEKFDGRATLRDHFTTVHNLTSAEYKVHVAKLRKEGKIPEMIPPKVKVVDPSFRYKSVPVADVDSDHMMAQVLNDDEYSDEPKKSAPLETKKMRKSKVKPSKESRVPGMGTVMNLLNDGDMFSPFSFDDLEEQQPKARDQEELNIVESAFKVAEEMDQLGESSSTIIVSGANSEGMYYSVPVVLNSDRKTNGATTSVATLDALGIEREDDMDDEYAQFAAEHAHIDGSQDFEQHGNSMQTTRIIKAEPLELYSSDQSHAVDMFNM